MPKKKSTAVLVIAIFHLIVGGFGVCGLGLGVIGLVGQAFQAAPKTPQEKLSQDFQNKLKTDVPGYMANEIGETGVNFILTVMLIVAGIGLIKMQAWARTVSIVYAILSILQKIFAVAFNVLCVLPVVNPAMDQLLHELLRQPGGPQPKELEFIANLIKGGMTAALIGLPLAGLIYPTIVLIIMLLPAVRRAFHEGRAGQDEYRSAEDDGYSDYERERDYPR